MHAERRVLLTGFEPWANNLQNPAQVLAERLHGWRWGGLRVAALVLPVAHVAASTLVAAALQEQRPSAVLHLGLAAGRPGLTVERWAHNLLDFVEPDTAGAQPRQQLLRPDGPPRLAASLDVDAAVRTLQAARVPAAPSDDAGAYVCNAVLYGSLAWAAAEGYGGPVGFVHLPTADTVSLADQERALRRLIRLLARVTTPTLAPGEAARPPRAPAPAARPAGYGDGTPLTARATRPSSRRTQTV